MLKNISISGNKKPGRTARRIQNCFIFLGINYLNNKINNMPWCTELSRVPLAAEYRKQIFKGVTQIFTVVISETVNFLQEK